MIYLHYKDTKTFGHSFFSPWFLGLYVRIVCKWETLGSSEIWSDKMI